MDEKVFISAEGLAEVKERLAYLKGTRRKEVADKLARISAQAQINTNQALEKILMGQ